MVAPATATIRAPSASAEDTARPSRGLFGVVRAWLYANGCRLRAASRSGDRRMPHRSRRRRTTATVLESLTLRARRADYEIRVRFDTRALRSSASTTSTASAAAGIGGSSDVPIRWASAPQIQSTEHVQRLVNRRRSRARPTPCPRLPERRTVFFENAYPRRSGKRAAQSIADFPTHSPLQSYAIMTRTAQRDSDHTRGSSRHVVVSSALIESARWSSVVASWLLKTTSIFARDSWCSSTPWAFMRSVPRTAASRLRPFAADSGHV